MASSKSQSSKGVDKRKREKIDQEDSSHKKKRRQKQQEDGTPRASPKRKAAPPEQHASEEDPTFKDLFSKHKPRSQSNGESNKSKALQKWRISEPMGGRMSDIDPIFSADEK
jgi:NET1-associated nuclear protein 1 (U3 small nucleolar RNA-associated protein 17)